ncbi:PLP-dependent aminotransferase family protein [Nakamurella flava]|uniref:PLP-dependent aminotransferase family protein n=1 Tax=Nakamurella flava TaxID=2576308 RepID=A0A4U6QAY3_9ACTN|nr:PLP-dependent aminotransferase family protein [Nakamurella flava]TKV57049.1 PLP-dependent aminotransferase family protein [Nakamurella flava]
MNDDSTGRLVRWLREWVAAVPPGTRLPSSRSLAAEHGVGPVTVQRATRALVDAGLVETRSGVGAFVRQRGTARPPDLEWQTGALGPRPPGPVALPAPLRPTATDVLALHSGYPTADLLPERLVHAALSRAARSASATRVADSAGLPELRAWFAGELAGGTPAGIAPPAARQVLVTPGSQSGLSGVFRALVGPGRPLLVESPTYWGALTAAVHVGVHVVPVPSGPDGPDPDAVDRAFAETGARAFYAQPSFANPTGTRWSAETGDAVLDVVRRRSGFLIEDDWAHDFGIDADPRPLAAQDDAGHVVYLRSLTKSVSPAIRVGAVIARGPAFERLLADHAAEAMYVSAVLQTAALDVVRQPAWTTHRRNLRRTLRDRRDLLLHSLSRHTPAALVDRTPVGGLHLWIRVPDGVAVDRLVRDCAADGVQIAAGDEWFPAEPTGSYVRASFAGPDPDRFDDAARVLQGAVDRQA